MNYKKTISVQGNDTTIISANILVEFNYGFFSGKVEIGQGRCVVMSRHEVYHKITVIHCEKEIITDTFYNVKDATEKLKKVEDKTIKFLTEKVNFVLDPYVKGCIHTLGYE